MAIMIRTRDKENGDIILPLNNVPKRREGVNVRHRQMDILERRVARLIIRRIRVTLLLALVSFMHSPQDGLVRQTSFSSECLFEYREEC